MTDARRLSRSLLPLAAFAVLLLPVPLPARALHASPAAPAVHPAAPAVPGDVVYATKSGKKYHSPSCPSGKNGSAMSEDDAKAKGLEPCSKCSGTPGPAREPAGDPGKPADPPGPPSDPPAPPAGGGAGGKAPPADPSAVVYATKSGKKYHSPSCPSGKNGSAMSEDDAKAKGLEPCSKCSGTPGPARESGSSKDGPPPKG